MGPQIGRQIRLSKSCLGAEEQAAVARVLAAEYLGMGEETRLFEEEVRDFIGGERDVVAVNSGTAALHLALAALDIGPGDEVLVPTITFVACFQVVAALGATAIACDVRDADILLDLADAARRVTKRTKAVMPVHYASNVNGIGEVYAFAARHGLRVVEDAAHSFGSTRDGKRIGHEGDVVCFSFDGIKNITTGEGGAVVTGDKALAQRLRDGRLLGVEKDTDARYRKARSWDFDVRHQGFRYHLSNINAAIGRAQLRKFDRFAAARVALAKRYTEHLGNHAGIKLLDIDYDFVVPHIFPVRVKNGRRDAARLAFAQNGIEWGYHYKPNHQLDLFRSEATRLPAADAVADELLTLPLHPDLTLEMQDAVIATLKAALGR